MAIQGDLEEQIRLQQLIITAHANISQTSLAHNSALLLVSSVSVSSEYIKESPKRANLLFY